MSLVHRLFFALQPPLPEQRQIGIHRDRLTNLDPVADPRLHVTVAITGDYASFPATAARRLCEIASAVAGEPIEIALDHLSGSARSVALRPGMVPHELRALNQALSSPMARAGLLRAAWTFSPHVTLGYREGAPFGRRIEPIRWESVDFVLIHSLVGKTRHDPLGRWPLTRRQRSLF